MVTVTPIVEIGNNPPQHPTLCTPYICQEMALTISMSLSLRGTLQTLLVVLVIATDLVHAVFLLRAARTSVYNRTSLTSLCLVSVTQITFVTFISPLLFVIIGRSLGDTASADGGVAGFLASGMGGLTGACKLTGFAMAWWRSATSAFLLMAIWQQYASQLTILSALCSAPRLVALLGESTSEAARRFARAFPLSTSYQLINATIATGLVSLLLSVYTVVLFDAQPEVNKDYRLGYFFRLAVCSFENGLRDLARPIFLFEIVFSVVVPVTLAVVCLSSMRALPGVAKQLFEGNQLHFQIAMRQLSTTPGDISKPILLIIGFVLFVGQHLALSGYRLWFWQEMPFDAFEKCQRSADAILLLYPLIAGFLLHAWCQDLIRKENSLYDPAHVLQRNNSSLGVTRCQIPVPLEVKLESKPLVAAITPTKLKKTPTIVTNGDMAVEKDEGGLLQKVMVPPPPSGINGHVHHLLAETGGLAATTKSLPRYLYDDAMLYEVRSSNNGSCRHRQNLPSPTIRNLTNQSGDGTPGLLTLASTKNNPNCSQNGHRPHHKSNGKLAGETVATFEPPPPARVPSKSILSSGGSTAAANDRNPLHVRLLDVQDSDISSEDTAESDGGVGHAFPIRPPRPATSLLNGRQSPYVVTIETSL